MKTMLARYKDDDYRERVRQIYGSPSHLGLSLATTPMSVDVSPTANVHRTFGGAFVEIQVWVPDASIESDGRAKG